ncbi:hypothetical protein CDL12_21415 [Handroanthus impetiginosus]|uniref:Homeobox-leucine zipper protein n=1 Tax=Handroanthus impetiginosus TaxID=429701 RepID=A0A2G9GLF6_9LAMI|nr:hypothetical protein CDL12_21415 [Handroanthus impetiginosus]
MHFNHATMDQFPYPQSRKHLTKHKKRLTQDQVRILETNFSFNNRLEPDRKSRLALELGVPARQVAIWYQNKRAREKNQSLEFDYKALQLRLENVLADNARLKGEVQRLKAELSKIQGVLNSFISPSSCDEVGNANLISKHDLEREFYASLIGGGGAFGGQDGYDFFGRSVS